METDALELINELEDLIDKGVPVPFTGRCLLDKDELLELIQEIKLKLPTDLEQAKWIKAERENIITANDKLIALIDENEITKQAAEKANSIVERANADAKTTKNESYQYADRLLENVETVAHRAIYELEQCVKLVQENRDQLK